MARKPKTPPAATPLVLPAELTIYSVGELHPQWLAWLKDGSAEHAEVQAGAVDQADAAGVQLLLSLQQALTGRGRQLALRSPSPALRDSCEALGLGDWLQAHAGAPA